MLVDAWPGFPETSFLSTKKENIMIVRKFLVIAFVFLFAPVSLGQDLNYGEGEFTASFTIDAAHTTDGINYSVAATGEAGDYGRVYLSYEFTDKLGMGTMGEFTGYAWTQNGEVIERATLQGVYRKNGAVFDMYSLDVVTNGLINIVSGQVDFVAKTMTFKVSPLQ
jgi:hypothetical protein